MDINTDKSRFRVVWESFKISYELGKKGFIYSIIAAAVSSITPYIPIFLSAMLIDMLASGEKIEKLLLTAGIGLVIIFALQLAEKYIDSLKDYHIEIAIRNFNMTETNKLFDLDYQQLDSSETNKLRERINNDNLWGGGFGGLYRRLTELFGSVFGLIAAISVIVPLFAEKLFWGGLFTPVFLTILIITVLTAVFIKVKFLSPMELAVTESHNKYYSERKDKYFQFFTWNYYDYKEGKDIRIYNAAEMILNYMRYGDKKRRLWVKNLSFAMGINGFMDSLILNILQGGVYILVVLRAVAGAISVGSVLIYTKAIINFINGISGIFLAFDRYYIAGMRQQGVLQYFSMRSEMEQGTLPVEKRADNEYEIEFKNVSFKYPGAENYALKNFNLKINTGRRMAVVGLNGSGKTTMIKLLCRLYDPTEGEISLNGIDIKKYRYNEYLSIFSVVFQDFKLFSFPLGQNVASSIKIDEEKARESLRKAGFGERLNAMKDGLNTALYNDFDKGVEISGGEAQKVAIARALYKNTPFIVLDEPTAALDPVAEFEIYSTFNDIVGNKTAIYISHRLSSCRFCDDIAVFHEGELVQRGSHGDLSADESGKYYELWNAQAQYYKNSDKKTSKVLREKI